MPWASLSKEKKESIGASGATGALPDPAGDGHGQGKRLTNVKESSKTFEQSQGKPFFLSVSSMGFGFIKLIALLLVVGSLASVGSPTGIVFAFQVAVLH
jgi:hypothetical protein